MRSFNGSSDSIRHRAASGNSRVGVMFLELGTDEITIYGQVVRARSCLGRLSVGMIGSLIACGKRQ